MDSVCDFYGQNEMDGVRFGGGCYGLGLAWGSLQLFFHSRGLQVALSQDGSCL